MNKLKYFRIKNKLSQKDVANILMITQPNYSNIETGKVKLNFDYAKILAAYYKIPISDLIDEKTQIYLTDEEFKTLIKAKDLIIELENKNK